MRRSPLPLAFLVASLWGARAAADPSPWAVNLDAYVWAAGIRGPVRTLPPLPAVRVNVGFSDILRNLDGAAMVTLDARKGRVLLVGDLVAARISPEQRFTVRGISGIVRLDSTSVTALQGIGYRFVQGRMVSLDGIVGAREFHLDNTLILEPPAPLPNLAYGRTLDWADATVGARGSLRVVPRLRLIASGFFGGFGGRSDRFTDWSAVADYRLGRRVSAYAGYRSLDVDHSQGPFLYDVVQQGPLAGVSIRF